MRAARLLVGPALLLTAAVLGASCDVGVPALDDPSRGFDRPPVRVLRAEIVSGYDADSLPTYQDLVEGAEAPSEVPISGSLRITFDRFLLPHKVLRQSLCVHPTTTTINTLADCAEPFQPFTGPTYDPIDRTVTYRLDPQTRLSPDTRYRVSLFVPANLDDNGFFAFDGAPLDRAYSFDFVTQPEGGDDVQEVLPNRANYCAARRSAR